MIPNNRLAATVSLALAACAFAPAVHAADDWEWLVAPYLWGPSVSTDLETRVPPDGGASNDNDFSDIVDKIEGAFEIHIEGQGDQFGLFADFTFLGLADSKDHPRFDTESDLDVRLFDAAAVWSPGADAYSGWELFGGLRYIDVDATVVFDPVDPAFANTSLDTGESFSDFMVGARYHWRLSERWSMSLRGDTSFGDTDGTWNVSAAASYRTNSGAWLFAYRHLSTEFETRFSSTELTLSGPMVGYGFRF